MVIFCIAVVSLIQNLSNAILNQIEVLTVNITKLLDQSYNEDRYLIAL